MAFKITQSPSFWFKVVLETQGEDGRHIEDTIRLKGKRKTRAEIEEEIDTLKGKRIAAELLYPMFDDWKDVSDENGPMNYTEENFAKLLDVVPGSAMKIYAAYTKALVGAREGN